MVHRNAKDNEIDYSPRVNLEIYSYQITTDDGYIYADVTLESYDLWDEEDGEHIESGKVIIADPNEFNQEETQIILDFIEENESAICEMLEKEFYEVFKYNREQKTPPTFKAE